ncbi:MAG: hypothetical protein AAGH79_08565 [Bacteroidota bacterium]
MKSIGLSFLLCLSSLILWGQYATVNYDLHKNYFNDGQPIPADEYLMFTGELPPAVERVELSIFTENRKASDEPLYQASWQNLQSSPPKNFQLPVNYGLKGSGAMILYSSTLFL